MNTLQLIYFIATNPIFETVVIKDLDDKTPMQAIEYLAGNNDNSEQWKINGTLQKNTLLVY